MDLLPSTTYVSPPRQARGRLNTILEEREDGANVNGTRSDSEGDHSDSTIIGRPAGWDSKLFVAVPRKASRLSQSVSATSPVSDAASVPEAPSPCSSCGPAMHGQESSRSSSYCASESGTTFSDDTVPSLASDPTTFATDSSRNSVASSTKSARNRYPALLIPRDSWNSMESPIKELTLPMSPGPKITLSPAVLSSLPYAPPPSEHATPSLGSSSSLPSESPSMASMSAPGTPDMRNLDAGNEEWGEAAAEHQHALSQNALEIAIDEDHSIVLSPAEAHSRPMSALMPPTPGAFAAMMSPREREWGRIVTRFPPVPGATPLQTPISGSEELAGAERRQKRASAAASTDSFQLPQVALATLNRLTRAPSPDGKSDSSPKHGYTLKEMRERSEPSIGSRPRSADGATPATDTSFSKLSDYSFTRLSIPSPGGFFSSLQSGARHTWCMPPSSRHDSVPSSAVAENFYHNWDNMPSSAASGMIKETVLSMAEDTNSTEGPPTARQPVFQDKSAAKTPQSAAFVTPKVKSPLEDKDMYGDGPEKANANANEPAGAGAGAGAGAAAACDAAAKKTSPTGFEYEEAYAEEIKQAAEANFDRTSSWLAAQTSYLSALRDNNPVNSPADYLPSPHPLSDDPRARSASMESHIQNTVRFLEEAQSHSQAAYSPYPSAIAAATANEQALAAGASPIQSSPASSHASYRDPVFFSAFKHLIHDRQKLDAFLHATSRMQAVKSDRLVRPEMHVDNLKGKLTIQTPKRPKYSGPFNHNPRATGVFERTAEQLKFEKCEREQRALDRVKQNVWAVDALKSVYGGRLLASGPACEKLSKEAAAAAAAEPQIDSSKRVRILDLGGDAAAGWGWEAALKWPNAKVYTVVVQDQAVTHTPASASAAAAAAAAAKETTGGSTTKPQGPKNHHVIKVPNAWQLPFKANRFDVITARSLHALLKAKPVPSAPGIDEWDLTLRECMRVLKPGGYIDFLVMDSSLVKSGPGGLGEKMSVEFGFELKRRGYDREAAKGLMRRLRRQGFVAAKRSWMFWPMGRKSWDERSRYTGSEFRDAPRPVSEVSTISKIVKQYMDVEAVQGPVGSAEAYADVCGLLGQRMWESWVVKVREENSGAAPATLLDNLDSVFDEGRKEGAGWRVLVGWAKKPTEAEELPAQSAQSAQSTKSVKQRQQSQATNETIVEEVAFRLDGFDINMQSDVTTDEDDDNLESYYKQSQPQPQPQPRPELHVHTAVPSTTDLRRRRQQQPTGASGAGPVTAGGMSECTTGVSLSGYPNSEGIEMGHIPLLIQG